MGRCTFVKSWPDKFRCADGDVVLWFSNYSSGILLLHSKVLGEHSKVFRAMFSTVWTRSLPAIYNGQSRYFQADLLVDCEEGVTYLQTNVSDLAHFRKTY